MAKVVNKEIRRGSIVQAAIAVFLEKGVAKSTMQDIAKAADVGKGTLYEYFTNKDELIVEVFAACNAELGELVGKAIAEVNDPLEQLFITVDTIGKTVPSGSADPLKMSFELWTEIMQKDDLNKKAVLSFRKSFEEFARFIQVRLDQAIENGSLKAVDTAEAANTIMAIIDGVFYHSVALGVPDELVSRLNKGVQTFIDAIRK